MRRPTLLILGHVTRDLFGSALPPGAGAPTRAVPPDAGAPTRAVPPGEGAPTRALPPDAGAPTRVSRLGGAAAFAAGAAALLGIDTRLVTVAPSNAPELDELRRLPGIQLAVADSDRITTFGHEFVARRRQLSLIERARPIVLDDVPAAWRSPEVVYVGPVAGECDEALLDGLSGAYGIGCIQGWLRDPVPGRRVRPRRLTEPCRVPQALRAVSFSASDHPGAPDLMRELGRAGVRVAVTRGRRGARVAWQGGEGWVPAEPAREVDPTGAGDVFALIFGLSSWAGAAPLEAARRAALAAARVVEGPGLGTLAQARQALAF